MRTRVLGRESLLRAMAIIGAWLAVAAGAVGLIALRVGVAGHLDQLLADAAAQLAIVPIWAVATPFILWSAEKWPVAPERVWPSLGVHFAAATLFVVASNAVIRLPLVARGAAPFLRSLAIGLTVYYVPALLAYGAIVCIGHILAWRRNSRKAQDDRLPSNRAALTILDRACTILVPYSEIEWVEAEDNYVLVHTRERSYTSRMRISDLERLLEGNGFARIHRSAIVRLSEVHQVRRLPHGDFDVALASGAVVRGSRSRRSALDCLVPEESVSA